MVPTCGMQQFKKIFYKYHLTFTGICCWREACKNLSEPGVVSTSPLRSGIGWGVSSALCDTVENWAKYASVASLSVDRYAHCLCMFVVMHPSTMLV